MSRGTADDDDAPIEITPEIIEGSLETDGTSPSQPTFVEASAADPRADLAFFLDEVAATPAEGPAAAPLIHEVAHIQESTLGDLDAALLSYRQAQARDPAFTATLGPLRRIFTARGVPTELRALYDEALRAAPLPARDRADLAVERGRILEDSLGRAAEAAASYRAAIDADPRHPAALLALLLLAARTADREGIETALAGLAEAAAASPQRRAALSVELARFQRNAWPPAGPAQPAHPGRPGGAGDPERALATVRAALAVADPSVPAGTLLQELGELTRLRGSPRVQIDAIDELLRHLPAGATALETALRREKAHLLRDVLRDPAAAFAELAIARRLSPGHPLATAEMLDIADETSRIDLIAGLASEIAAGDVAADGSAASATSLVIARLAEALFRGGRAAEALALLREQGGAPAAADPALFALEVALLAETGDAAGLAQAFEREGEAAAAAGEAGGGESTPAHALVRAAALREIVLEEPARAEALYRRALALDPGYAPAVDALEEKLRAAGRWGELGDLLEKDLAGSPAPPAARQRYLLETLVVVRRDRLGDVPAALETQRRLVALDPDDAGAWVVLHDLELAVELAASGDAAETLRNAGVVTLTELARRAGSGALAVSAALKAEAARLEAAGGTSEARRHAEKLYRDARADDRSGLAAGGLESMLDDAPARLDAISSELELGTGQRSPSQDRALHYRLAFEHAAARHWKQAVASLRSLRDAGDRLARAWSYDLARRSGDPKLVVALLRELAPAPVPAGDAPATGADSLPGAGTARIAAADLGESLERAGDGPAAQAAFRDALRGQDGPASSMDAALGLYRASAAGTGAAPPVAAGTDPAVAMAGAKADLDGVVEALRTIAVLSSRDPAVAGAAIREADLVDAARGRPVPAAAAPAAGSTATEPSPEGALLRWMTGVRAGDHAQVADALMSLAARLATAGEARVPPAVAALAARAAARSRLAGAETARAVHRRAWAAAPRATVAHALADLQSPGMAAGPPGTPDTRAGRATRAAAAGPALADALDLERALDLETAGELGEALAAYGNVLARDAEHLEAMEGIRRVARAAGDLSGEARATARLGALARAPGRTGALYREAGLLFERAGRPGDAIAMLLKVLELQPDDEPAFRRLLDLLRAAAGVPGNAKTLDRVLGHWLVRRRDVAPGGETIQLLAERAHNRLHRLEDRESAVQDFKRILKIDPHHENALRQLATLAIEMRRPADAAALLERYLVVTDDEEAAAAARLELADAYEAAQDAGSAIRVLRSAVDARAGDTVALGRLADLSLRAGDWPGAVEALRIWETFIGEPLAKADLFMRIGALLRDEGYDVPAAAIAFRRAADLDPLGDGTRALARLYESAGDGLGRQQVIEDAIVEARQALEADPLDLPRLSQLRELLDATPDVGSNRAASIVVGDLLSLLDGDFQPHVDSGDRGGPRAPEGVIGSAFWNRLADPTALGFMTEIWALLADAAGALFPVDAGALGAIRQNRVAAGAEPRLGWVEKTAAALGLPGVLLHLVPDAAGRAGGAAMALELPAPALVFGQGALGGDGASIFSFGQALGLLRQRATPLPRIAPDDLHALYLAAGVIAAGGPADAPKEPPVAAQVKALGKVIARKDRKALVLQSSRFDFELSAAQDWQRGVLRTADRLGLLLCGDVVAAVRVLAGLPATGPADTSAAALGRRPAVVDLIRFALGQDYLALRQEAGLARD